MRCARACTRTKCLAHAAQLVLRHFRRHDLPGRAVLLYLAYLLASGYRVALFAGKVSLMGVLCASVPVIFSKLNVEGLSAWEVIKMLFTRGGTYFWEGGVLGAPIGAALLALFGRPASNILMLLVFLLGLMFFFAITPADVVLFVNNQYQALQSKREERASAETAYDTRLFEQEPEEESVENLTGTLPGSEPPASSGLRRHRRHEPLSRSSTPHRLQPAQADLHGPRSHQVVPAGSLCGSARRRSTQDV